MVAWQRQIRDKYVALEPHEVPADLSTASVREIDYQTAKTIILKYEWLGNMGTTARTFGLFFGEELAGVTCFGHPQGVAVNICGEENADKVYWLARGACVHWAHPHSASFLINESCKMFAQPWKTSKGESKSPKFVFLATADTDAGEIGTVYQASNWLYVGKTSEPTMYKFPHETHQQAKSYDAIIKNFVRVREGRSRDEKGKLRIYVDGRWYSKGKKLPDGSVVAGTEKYPFRIKQGYGKTIQEAVKIREKEVLAESCPCGCGKREKIKGNSKHMYVGIYGDARMKRVLRKSLKKQILTYPKRIAGKHQDALLAPPTERVFEPPASLQNLISTVL
jgi:hypothetical protein